MQIMLDTKEDGPVQYRAAIRLLEELCGDHVPDDFGDSDESSAPDGPKAPPPEVAQKILQAEGFVPPPPATMDAEAMQESDVDVDTDEPTPVPPPPPVPASPPPAAEPVYHSRGIAWSAEVHASNRATKIDGSWKARRGVDPAKLAEVEKNGPKAAPVPGNNIPPPPPPPVPSVAGSSVPTPPAAAPGIDFRSLMLKITGAKLSDEQVSAAMGAAGLKSEDMGLLIGNDALIGIVNAAVDRAIAGG